MPTTSTFAQRFEFARAAQHLLGTWQEDSELAAEAGVASSRISEYKERDEAPPARRTLALAEAIGVDPGWLAFGEASAAPAPNGFTEWLARRYPPKAADPAPKRTATLAEPGIPKPQPGSPDRRRRPA